MATRKPAQNTSETVTTTDETVPEVMDFGGADGWRPEPGDTITIEVTNLTIAESEYGVYPLVEGLVKAENGTNTKVGEKVAMHAFHTVLRKDLARIRPEIGNELTVTYHGRKGEGGKYKQGYETYTVTSPQYKFNWDMFGKLPTAPDVNVAAGDQQD